MHDTFFGTVYGTLLNCRAEYQSLAPQMADAPHNGAPRAPILYIKTANTWSASGANIPVPARVPRVEVGATIGLIFGPSRHSSNQLLASHSVASIVLLNDLSIPHASFFRPPVKYKCLDGFLGLGPHQLDVDAAGDPADWVLDVHINGEWRQRVDFSTVLRSASQLITDVREFMTLHPGDVLTLGCDIAADGQRPLAQVGDLIEITAPGLPGLGTLSNRLVAEATA
jgi:5-oxopent-3-ene-1,2,5-tricarboxylate decarboxylase / 2-hydroxyhepta-2,4-diene-1,7-dioate isomerase